MNNLTTRKIVLGMLMALVLAFSVQGIADALEFKDHSSSDGDLRTVLPGDEFKIKFSVSLKSNTTKIYDDDNELIKDGNDPDPSHRIDSSGYKVVEVTNGKVYRLSEAADALTNAWAKDSEDDYTDVARDDLHVDSSRNVFDGDGNRVYTADGGSTRAKADPDDKVDAANRYHYNDEAVTVEITSGPATFKKVGSSNASGTELDLIETGKDATKLSTSITLTLLATPGAAAAPVVISITDATAGEDLPNGIADRDADGMSFTVYVVPGTSTADLKLAGEGDGIENGNDFGPKRIDDLFTVVDNVPLTYEVQGSGRVFVRINDERESSTTSKLETSSSAPVYIDMKKSSNRVTVWVRGTDAKRASKSITFINTYADPQITDSSDNQSGAAGGRLEEHARALG